MTGPAQLTRTLAVLLASMAFAPGLWPQTGEAPAGEAKQFVLPPRPTAPEPELVPPPPLDQVLSVTNPSASLSASDQTQALLGRSPEALPPPPAVTLLRAIIGIVALMALAFIAGSQRVHAIEREFNVAHLMSTGLPFVLIGLVASIPAVGILSQPMLREIGPVLPLGLGWIGFVIGTRLDVRSLNNLPRGTPAAVALITGVPFVSIAAAMVLTLALTNQQAFTTGAVRDSILLGTAGAMAARSAPVFLKVLLPDQTVPPRLLRIIEHEQLAGVFGLMMVSAFYRPPSSLVGWVLPGAAWLFMTVGLGATMGIVVYATMTRINKDPQFTAALLGCVAFTAGIASYLRLAPLAVCFMAGAIMINFGGEWRQRVMHVFQRLERPIYFLFMVIAGALWHPWEWQGWVLMLTFVAARLGSKWISSRLVRKSAFTDLSSGEQRALTLAPMGALSVAIVVSAQDLYSGPTVAWIVTAVVGGLLVSETILQVALRRIARRAPALAAPAPPLPQEVVPAEVD